MTAGESNSAGSEAISDENLPPVLQALGFQIPPDHRPPPAPQLNYTILPDIEKREGHSLHSNLMELYHQSLSYSESYFLQKHCGEWFGEITKGGGDIVYRTVWPGWMRIGAHSAILSARNYSMALTNVSRIAGKIPSWSENIDLIKIRSLKRSFAKRFPDVVTVRDSVAHPEEYSNPNKLITPPGFKEEIYMKSLSDSLTGYTTTFNGRIVSCEISDDAAKFLINNVRDVFSAFEKLI